LRGIGFEVGAADAAQTSDLNGEQLAGTEQVVHEGPADPKQLRGFRDGKQEFRGRRSSGWAGAVERDRVWGFHDASWAWRFDV
jgi:hypothetical protein